VAIGRSSAVPLHGHACHIDVGRGRLLPMLDAHGKVPSLAWIVRALQFVTFIKPFSDQPQERGFGGSVGVNDAGGHTVLVPADTFVFDCFFEAVFVVIKTRGTGARAMAESW
jgi:hypothetical protein